MEKVRYVSNNYFEILFAQRHLFFTQRLSAMARTKRAKVVSLTQTKGKTREHKENFMEQVREAANQYNYVWVFAVSNMRNAYLNEVRKLWTGSRIFFGKLRVIAKALGETREDELRPGLGALSKRLRGNVGLLFTDSPPAEVLDWCSDYARLDYARMGNRATETITLPEGPVMIRTDPPETLPHNIEPQLRALGMPTTLKRGVPSLLQEFTVCKEGEKLTAERAQILKHLVVQMAHFRLIPLAYWTAVGTPEVEEGTVIDVPLSDADRELVDEANASLGSKRAPKEDMDEEPTELDMIEERDSGMMLPEGVNL